ncbi:MAG: dockerin type I repeat-containing protein [Acutalibacteraceae bacterium]|nr:dockerin type I repeat-containing protein [Acutalibacteraceae bacterium]
MKKISAVCSILLALIMALSCLALPVSAAGVTVVRKPNQTSFYQGVDWMYDKNGTVTPMSGDLNLAGTILSCNGEQVEFKKGVTGPNMYAKSADGSWKAGKNTVHIFCDSFGSSYATLDVNFVSVTKIEIVRAPKTKLVLDIDWKMGIAGDVEMTKYDLTGTIIKATYGDSTVKEISYPNACLNWSIPDGTDVIMPGNRTLYITFCGQRAPISVVFLTQKSFAKGDVSLDGEINSYDALNILQYSTGSITLGDIQFGLGDVDGNGRLNSSDALNVLQYVVGIKKTL